MTIKSRNDRQGTFCLLPLPGLRYKGANRDGIWHRWLPFAGHGQQIHSKGDVGLQDVEQIHLERMLQTAFRITVV